MNAEKQESLRKMKEEKLGVARNLLFEGSDVEFVAKVTGLALDEVKGLKRELAN